jgi:hypothetical protein
MQQMVPRRFLSLRSLQGNSDIATAHSFSEPISKRTEIEQRLAGFKHHQAKSKIC